MSEKGDEKFQEKVAYVLGLVAIITSVSLVAPLAAVVSSIAGLILLKGEKSQLAKTAKKLNIWGLVIGLILSAITFGTAFYITWMQLKAGGSLI